MTSNYEIELGLALCILAISHFNIFSKRLSRMLSMIIEGNRVISTLLAAISYSGIGFDKT